MHEPTDDPRVLGLVKAARATLDDFERAADLTSQIAFVGAARSACARLLDLLGEIRRERQAAELAARDASRGEGDT